MCSDFLFRGVSLLMHKSGEGLRPRSTVFTQVMHLDTPGLFLDMGWTLDDSEENAVIGHQLNSGVHLTAGVSTTAHFDRAKHYATSGSTCSGVVYKIERSRLGSCGVEEHVVSGYTDFPKYPEDDEVILVHREHGPLPLSVVVDIIPVAP
jgi:hypothetical protein